MATVAQQLGPEDHGREMSYQEFMEGDYQHGYRYEIIRGKLDVSPLPNAPEDFLEKWLLGKLFVYAQTHPQVIRYLTDKARVFVPSEEEPTVPEPDIAAYKRVPRTRSVAEWRWEDMSPMLVVEVLSANDARKDLDRNVELYLLVPSIKEYWIVDGRADPERPILRVYRRHGDRWRNQTLRAGATYTTRLLPGFSLTLDPHR
jgi:Uma2 family endonuclease